MTRRKKAGRGSMRKIHDEDLGHGLRLQVHELRPPQSAGVTAGMEQARLAAAQGQQERAANLAYDVWRRARGDKFVEVWAGQMLAKWCRTNGSSRRERAGASGVVGAR